VGVFVERQNSTGLLDMTEFLQSGALLRHTGQNAGVWTLVRGPFKAVESPDFKGLSVFFPNFYETASHPFWQGSEVHTLNTSELQSICESFLGQNSVSPNLHFAWQEPQESDFAVALQEIQKRIQAGSITKAVPAVFARAKNKLSAVDIAQMILNLTKAPETLYVYGFWQNGEGVLGATPEVLINYQDGDLQTMALAGTCPKEESASRDSLLQDPKEMQEHQFVVEDIENMLSAYGKVEKDGPHILELPTLYHLKTDMKVRTAKVPAMRVLIESLHPTPALGVAPRSAGYTWLKAFPGQEGRKGFGAPFAFISEKEALCLVAIRNIQWNRDELLIGSGCGVVAASELSREWRELGQKRLSVRKILGL
jgi:menaquinone-specific isochorismate synthase